MTNYDVLSNTVATLAKAEFQIPAYQIHRILDDVPFVAPASSDLAFKFSRIYIQGYGKKQESCWLQSLDCPEIDKAFSRNGKSWGCFTRDLTWSLPKMKEDKASGAIRQVLDSDRLSLKKFQSLTGCLNDIGQMCHFF